MKKKFGRIIIFLVMLILLTSATTNAIQIKKEKTSNELSVSKYENIVEIVEDDIDPTVDLEVTVSIKKIRALDELDRRSEADFYVKVFINGEEHVSEVWKNDNFVEEEWDVTADVPDNEEFVTIIIELWDSDLIFDDLCDIAKNDNSNPSRFSLDLSYSLKAGHWTGDDLMSTPHTWDPDYSGYGRGCGCDDNSIYEDDKDCEIWFDITQNDYDGDGIPYWTEVNKFCTDPMVDNTGEDFDDDDVPIEWEFKWGHYFDWDYNYTTHEYTIDHEWQYHPLEWNDHKNLDPDGDSLNNYEEYLVSKWYSDPFRQDIYVELGQMEAGPNGEPASILPEGAKELIFKAFDRQNIVFHLDDGEMGGSEMVPFDVTGDNTTRRECDDIYQEYFLHNDTDNWRKGVFHYGLLVYNATWAGYAFGADAYQISSKQLEEKAKRPLFGSRDVVYGSCYMHELGHTLDLTWLFGHADEGYGPQYLLWWKARPYKSIMNYGYMYGFIHNLVDYSDGSRGKNDFDDWSNIDFSYFDR